MADSYRCQAADRQPQKQRGGDGHVLVQKLIFTYDSWPIPRPKKLATSPTFHGRWISNTNGSNRPSNKHFAKRSFHLAKIKLSVHGFLQMTPKLLEKYVFIPRF
jgi:hypothetical protein